MIYHLGEFPASRFVILLLLGACVSSLLYVSEAQSGVTFKPSIVLREEYDDNIFLAEDDRKSDFITRILPSFHVDYKTPIWDLNSDYTLNWWYYVNLREAKNSHNLHLTSQFRPVKNLFFIDMSDTYSSVVLNPRRPSTDVNLDVNRSDSNNATISSYVKYQVSPIVSLSAGYRYNNIWYRRGDAVNRQMHTGFATAEYVITRQLKTSVSGEYTDDRPESNPLDKPNNQTAIFIKTSYTLSARTDMDGSLGYRWAHFSDGRKKNMPIYSMLITYRFHETGRIEMSANSALTPSAELGMTESRTAQLSILYGKPFTVTGSLLYRRDKYIESDEQDETLGLTLGVTHKLNTRLTYKVSGKYEHARFLPEHRNRDTYGGSGEIAYALTKEKSISLIYNHTTQDGHTELDDYHDNIMAVQANITF